MEAQQVLLQLLIRQVVHQHSIPSMFRLAHLSPPLPLSPALLLQGWRFVKSRFAASHIQQIIPHPICRGGQDEICMDRAVLIIFSTKFLFSSYNYSHYFYWSLMASPSQLFSCVQSDAIQRSPINNSTAKTNWSFSKDSRFKRPNCDSFYEIPGVKQNQNRRAGFGIGKKTDLEFDKNPLHVVPPPNTYNLSTFIETNKLHAKGFTPRFSREEIAPMSYIQLEPYKVPGPGRYEEYRYNQSPKWSLHDRTSSEIFPQTTVRIVPGPGTYVNQDAIQLNPVGQYHLSNHRNSKAKVFNPPRSRRFYKSSTDVPGAGVYHPQNDLSNEGKYILSKHVSAGKRKFMDGRRLSFTDIAARRSFTPGPGSYRAPSQFGQYDLTMRSSSTAGGQRVQNCSSKTDRTKATQG